VSIKTILDRVCYEAGLPSQNGYAANTGRTAKELIVHAHEAGEEIMQRAEWSKLWQETSINAGTSIILPDDFHRLVRGGAVIREGDNYQSAPYAAVKSADIWNALKAGGATEDLFFARNGALELLAAPLLGESITAHYICKNWLDGPAGRAFQIASDDDAPLFSDILMAKGVLWRFKRAKGLKADDIMGEFEAEFKRELAADRGYM